MRARIRRLPAAAEFVFVIAAAFGLPIASAVWFVAAGHRRATMTNGDLVGIWIYEIVATIAIAASALIRFAYHVYEHWLAVLGILPMGIIFATFYRRRGQLWPLLVAHALGDLVGLVGTAVAT